MPKKIMNVQKDAESFGQRLARFRKNAGYSQRELAERIGVSQRMIAYYETETHFPATHLLSELAKILNVTSDELLGLKPTQEMLNNNSVLLRCFSQIADLPQTQQQQIVSIIDAFLEGERLRKLKSA